MQGFPIEEIKYRDDSGKTFWELLVEEDITVRTAPHSPPLGSVKSLRTSSLGAHAETAHACTRACSRVT
ncbi:hypothetical protein EON66_00570 [archaeon]|nr:MAG: hypothetical protein EON66_00570 [archaeon]